MRLEQLEYFLKVAETASITQAGKALYTSPQNVSKSIKQLEDELGAKLFYRFKNGTFLTDDGLRAYENAKIIVEQSEKLKNAFAETDAVEETTEAVSLNMMITPLLNSLIFTVLNNLNYDGFLLSEICISRHDIETLNNILFNDIKECCRNNDIILACFDHAEANEWQDMLKNDFVCYMIWQDKVCLEVNIDDGLAEQDVITTRQLEKVPIVIYASTGSQETYTEKMFKKKGVTLNIKYRLPSEDGKRYANQHNVYSIVGSPTNELRPYPGHVLVPIEGDFLSDVCLLAPRPKANKKMIKSIISTFDNLFGIRKLF